MSDKELLEDYKKMELDIRESSEDFDKFVSDLYMANCHERTEHGQPIFGSAKEYYDKYKIFIKTKYYEKRYKGTTKPTVEVCTPAESWSYNADGVPVDEN